MATAAQFDKIVSFYRQHQRMPSYREIMHLVNFRSKDSAFKLVHRLMANGRLAKDTTGRLLPTRYFFDIPWLGSVVAGYPSPAEEELIDIISLEEFLIKNKQATYMLEVKGDSMIDAGILEGDTIIVRKCDDASNGDIVVALVDEEEATLKRLRRRGDSIALEAANPAYETRIFGPDRVRVQGRLVGLIRRY